MYVYLRLKPEKPWRGKGWIHKKLKLLKEKNGKRRRSGKQRREKRNTTARNESTLECRMKEYKEGVGNRREKYSKE